MAPVASPDPTPHPPSLGARASRPPSRHERKNAGGTPALPGGEATLRVAIATTASRAFALAGGLLIVTLIALPVIASRSLVQDLVFIFYMFTLAQFCNLLPASFALLPVVHHTFSALPPSLPF